MNIKMIKQIKNALTSGLVLLALSGCATNRGLINKSEGATGFSKEFSTDPSATYDLTPNAAVSETFSSSSFRPYGLAVTTHTSSTTVASVGVGNSNGVIGASARNVYDIEKNRGFETDFALTGELNISPEFSPLGCTSVGGGFEYWTSTGCNNHAPVAIASVKNSNCLFNTEFVAGINTDEGREFYRASVSKPIEIGEHFYVGPRVDAVYSNGFFDGNETLNGWTYLTPSIQASLHNNRFPSLSLDVTAGYQFGLDKSATQDMPFINLGTSFSF
jgi:hypothetical protein